MKIGHSPLLLRYSNSQSKISWRQPAIFSATHLGYREEQRWRADARHSEYRLELSYSQLIPKAIRLRPLTLPTGNSQTKVDSSAASAQWQPLQQWHSPLTDSKHIDNRVNHAFRSQSNKNGQFQL